MRLSALLALLVVGCGSTALPPENDNDNAGHRHSGGEAVCVERSPAAPPLGGLDGRWFLLEPGDEDVEMVFDIEGDRGRAYGEDESESIPLVVVPRDDGLGEVTLTMNGAELHVLLLPRGPGSMLAIAQGEEDARLARRQAPLPAFLEGRWTIVDPRGREAPVELEIRGDLASLVAEGQARTVRLFGLASDGPSIDIVGQRQDRGADYEWLSLQTVSPDVLIVREGDEEEFGVMHRPGMAPPWLATFARPSRGYGPGVPDTETVAPPPD